MIQFNNSNDNESISYNNNNYQLESIPLSPIINQNKYIYIPSNNNQNQITNSVNDKSIEQNIFWPTESYKSQVPNIIIESSVYQNNEQVNKKSIPFQKTNKTNTKNIKRLILVRKTHRKGTKKRGRKMKNNEHLLCRTGKEHDKNGMDNKSTKVKRDVVNSVRNHLNNLCKESKIEAVRSQIIKKFDPKYIIVPSKDKNLKLFDTTFEHMLLNWNVSGKYGKKPKDGMPKIRGSQAKTVSIIKKDIKIKKILSMNFEELLSIYSHKEKQIGLFQNFQGIDGLIEKLKKKGEKEEYLEELRFRSQNLRSDYEKKISKKKKQ